MRFPVALPLRYKATTQEMALVGTGRTVFMNSTQVTFATEQVLEQGMNIELSVVWPVLLDGRVRLKLIVHGIIVRSEGLMAAAKIVKYYFRTRGATEALAVVAAEAPVYAGSSLAIATAGVGA